MSAAEFALLASASWLLIWLPEYLLAVRIGGRAIRPTAAWVHEPREGAEAAEAWEATAGLPFALIRVPFLHVVALIGILIWGFLATDALDLPRHALFVFFAASILIYLYALAVRFLALEALMRPVLAGIGSALPADRRLDSAPVPLRWRLLASLVAVILITGIAVGGFVAGDGENVRALGLALLGSAVVAIVVASWLIGLLSASITNPITRLRDAALRVGRGHLDVRVPLTSTDETAELTRAFNEMVAGLAQREQLREAFGAFVDPDLTQRILDEGVDLSGRQVEASVLFMDVRGFTSYAEGADPQAVLSRLNGLFGTVVPIILDHGGHANKFIGDGLLAVFGAPNRLSDHADQAVAAGLELVRRINDSHEDGLRVGVGVNSGPVVAGTVGGGGRLDFTVIGDVVNTAARVEGATRTTGDDLLITATTKLLLKHVDEDWRERPGVELKGKTQPISLFGPGPL